VSILLGHPHVEHIDETGPLPDEAVRRQVWKILAGLYPPGRSVERRVAQRFPYPHLLYLTPVADDGISPAGNSLVVVGKHLSERGLGFFYPQQSLPDRRVIASLEVEPSRWAGFLLEIVRYRFTQHGWYDSGGRFLQVVPSPIAFPSS
jgi:hypothetical protein